MGRNKHCSVEERRIAHNLKGKGKTLKFIAETLGRSVNFVAQALKPQPVTETRGRPRKTDSTMDNRIVLLAKRNPFTSSRTIAASIDNVISAPTVRRRLQENNLPGRIARKVPLLSKKNIRARKQFAENLKNNTTQNYRNILWSDETKINIFGSDSRRNVRRPKGKEFHPLFTKKTVKHGGGSVMVWGSFSWFGVGPIVLIENIMTKEIYRDILQNHMLPYAEENMPLIWHFQQDNDPKHSSKLVSAWLRDQQVSVLPWPSQSPDLNPIENLWGELKKSLATETFHNKTDLWTAIQRHWNSIPIEK